MNYSTTYVGIIMLLFGPQLAKYGIADAEVSKFVELAVGVVGALIAAYGRKNASKPVTILGTYTKEPEKDPHDPSV